MSSRAARSSTPAGALTSRNEGDGGPVLEEVAGRTVVKVGDVVILWTEDTSGWGDLSGMGGGHLVSDGFSDGSCWVKDDISVPNIVGSLFRVTIKQVCRLPRRFRPYGVPTPSARGTLPLPLHHSSIIVTMTLVTELRTQMPFARLPLLSSQSSFLVSKYFHFTRCTRPTRGYHDTLMNYPRLTWDVTRGERN